MTVTASTKLRSLWFEFQTLKRRWKIPSLIFLQAFIYLQIIFTRKQFLALLRGGYFAFHVSCFKSAEVQVQNPKDDWIQLLAANGKPKDMGDLCVFVSWSTYLGLTRERHLRASASRARGFSPQCSLDTHRMDNTWPNKPFTLRAESNLSWFSLLFLIWGKTWLRLHFSFCKEFPHILQLFFF